MSFEDVKRIRQNPTAEDVDNQELHKMIDLAVEKQIPKKIIENTETDRVFIDYVCPNCNTILQQKMKQAKRKTIYKYKHCIDCGQALLWESEER